MQDIWQALAHHHSKIADRRISDLCDDDSRFDSFSCSADGLLLDYAKTNIDADARALLLDLAVSAGIEGRREAMFRGDRINTTEERAALHTALRAGGANKIQVDGVDIVPEIRATRARMAEFASGIRTGKIAASDGVAFSDVISIGIGGSDLGPVMATLALAPYHDGPRCHFVANVDAADLADTLKGLDAARTLVILASKTFTTIETMTNATSVIAWLTAALGDRAGAHLAAVTSATRKAVALGIDPARIFGFGDFVGGRYSLWGPVGLPIMLAVGPQDFATFLDGGAAMDAHFRTAPLAQNLPVLLALVGVWHRNVCRYPSRAILPYDQRLRRLPAYLQQLDMESNGKSVTLDGRPVERPTGPVVWGEPGTNGQHAFYQLLHQGSDVVPAEFLIAATGHEPQFAHHHDLLIANCLAQSEALMVGQSLDAATALALAEGHSEAEAARLAPHRTFEGNRPSVTLAYRQLTPFILGQIIALYEHRVFTEAAIWGINPFDQFGVELGKVLANDLMPMVKGADASGKDASTRGLLQALGRTRKGGR